MGTPELGFRRSSLAWAVEGSFGSLDGNGLPDPSGLVFTRAEVVAFNAYEGLKDSQTDRDIARGTLGRAAPELLGPIHGGARQEMLTGEMTIRFKGLRCPVAGQTTDTLLLAALKKTVMQYQARTAGDQDTVAAGSHSVNSFAVTTAAEFYVGQLLAFTIDDHLEFARVTGKSGSTLTVSPALSAIPVQGDIIRHVETYTPLVGPLAFDDNPSLALRYDQAGRAFYATGCRLMQYTIETAGPGAIPTVTAKVMLTWVKAASSPAPGNVPTQGVYAERGQSYDTYSSLIGATAPADVSRSLLQARRWSLTCDFDLTPIGTGEVATGVSDYMVSDFRAELKMAISPDGTLEAARLAMPAEHFMVQCGLGPTTAGVGGRAKGYVVQIPRAHLAEYAKPNASQAETVIDLTWHESDSELDSGTWTNGEAQNSPFSDGWVA